MSEKTWFLHVDGEAIGPLSTATLTKMLEQNRCNPADYVWSEGLFSWMRIADCQEFAGMLPPVPKIPTPRGGVATAAPAPAKAAAKPKAVAKPAPKIVAPEPEPEPEAEEVVAEAEPEEIPEETVEIEPAPKPVAKPKAAVAAKPKPVAVKPAPAPAPPPVPKSAALAGTAKVDGGAGVSVLQISETNIVIEKCAAEMGADVKLRVEAKAFPKPLDLTGVVSGDADFEGKAATTIEFTRMNPAHRRSIAQYLASLVGAKSDKKAA